MCRERALKVVLVLLGLLFSAVVYALMMFVRQEPALAMMLRVYVTLGIFLLLAARDPSAHRSLIAFTAWSSFAHAALMAVQAFRNLIARGEPWGVAVLVIIGVALIVPAPAKKSGDRASMDFSPSGTWQVHSRPCSLSSWSLQYTVSESLYGIDGRPAPAAYQVLGNSLEVVIVAIECLLWRRHDPHLGSGSGQQLC